LLLKIRKTFSKSISLVSKSFLEGISFYATPRHAARLLSIYDRVVREATDVQRDVGVTKWRRLHHMEGLRRIIPPGELEHRGRPVVASALRVLASCVATRPQRLLRGFLDRRKNKSRRQAQRFNTHGQAVSPHTFQQAEAFEPRPVGLCY
jgi:hypothetical protein